MDIALATGVTIDYDETDLKEHKRLSNYAFYSPSVEFYLKEEKDNLNKVIIVGAGVSGLVLADEITKRTNKKVLLLEKEKKIGDKGGKCEL